MEAFLSICIGVGLSAACGFRVFVPLLVVGIAAKAGHLTLGSGFDWMASDAAIGAFALATLLEVGGYYVPWVDNLLDSVATPAAIIAGTIVTASFVADVSPLLKWTLAVIAGGGAAGAVQVTTVGLRAASSAGSGGVLNPVFATAELGGSVLTSLLSIVVPGAAIIALLIILGLVAYHFIWSRKKPVIPRPCS